MQYSNLIGRCQRKRDSREPVPDFEPQVISIATRPLCLTPLPLDITLYAMNRKEELMSDTIPSNGKDSAENKNWGNLDFSGLTVILGAGTGHLIELVGQRVAASDGTLLVVNYDLRAIQALTPLREQTPLHLVQGRPRQIPVLDQTVDLLVLNGILRQVPKSKLEVMFEELWRVLIPGGRFRISDIIEPTETEYNRAWAERNRIVRRLGLALDRPTALSVDLKLAAAQLRAVGFEDLALSILPGYALTDAWLEKTVNTIRNMSSRIVDRDARHQIIDDGLERLIAAYKVGGQRAAERFVLRGKKVGNLALTMEASFTEDDLQDA